MASRFTPDTLADQYANFLTSRGSSTGAEEALEVLLQHAPELSAETLRQPKVVLVAREFPPVVTATCVWLAEMGLDIQLTRFQAYRSGEQTLLTVSQLFPVPDVEDFTISPRQAEVKQASETKKRSQDVSAVRRLVEAGAIPDGTELTLAMGPGSRQRRAGGDRHVGRRPPRAPRLDGRDRTADDELDGHTGAEEWHAVRLFLHRHEPAARRTLHRLRRAGANKASFDTLAERREEIEATFGAQLSWERLDSKRASRIAAYRTGDVDNTDRHEEYIDWFVNASQQLRQALPVPD